jgi:PKD repeat protein
MSKKIRVFLAVVLVFVLSNFSWAYCPEDTVDLGICDTLYVAPSSRTDTCFILGADTICINNPGQQFPCFWYVHLLVTHDSNTFWWSGMGKWVQDSIAAFEIPLTWTRTNQSKYCSLSAYWNTSDYSGAGLSRSVFRDHQGMQNRMLDLQWSTRMVTVSTSPPYLRMMVMQMYAGEQYWWESERTLLATLTFKLQDTMTVSFDSTFFPPNTRLKFARRDAMSYTPRLKQLGTTPDLIADFSASPTSVAPGCTVQFTDLSSGNPTSWRWDFGDDSTSTLKDPLHAYENTGYFDVKLVISNQTSTDSITKYDYIHVFCPGYIAGHVRDTLGQPIYLAKVIACEISETTYTDPGGYFEFTNLEPVSYTLLAKSPDYTPRETTGVAVFSQETTWVDLTLRPQYFSVYDYQTVGTESWGAVSGDFTGDNNVDIIALNLGLPQRGITRLWGNGDGTFTLQPYILFYGIVQVKGYFNSDDFLDLVVATWDSIAVFLNKGNGDFLPPKYFELHGQLPMSIAKGFLDWDANLDIVTANSSSSNISLFTGVGDGDLVFVKNLNISTQSVDVGDFNKDGNADLVVGTNDSLYVLLGDGNYNFTRSYAHYFGYISSVSTMNALADFNHDGNLDVIFAMPQYGPSPVSRIGILLGDGLGGFSSVTVIYAPDAVIQTASAGDFNGDNDLDFAASYCGGFTGVKVFFGDGTGNFPDEAFTDIGHASFSVATADFNEDGNEDIVSANLDDYVSVLLNRNPAKPRIEDEFVLTGYTSVNLNVTDKYGISANILANTMAGADYFQKDCNSDSTLDDRVYHFNAVPGRYRVGVTPSPGSEPGGNSSLGIRINGTSEVFIPNIMKGFQAAPNDTIFFIITDSLPTLCLPADAACLHQDTLTLFWNKIDGTSRYHFQLDDNSDFSSPVIDDSAVTDTSLTITSPLSGNKYYWRVRANGGVWSVFSETRFFFTHFITGDVNGDGLINLGDVVYLISYQYKNGPAPVPLASGDVTCDGLVNLGDVVYLITYQYKNGPPPAC